MRTIQLLETLLEELDNVESVDEVRSIVEDMLDEEYELEGVANALDEMSDDSEDDDNLLH